MGQIKEGLTLTDLLTRDDVLEGISTKDTLMAHGVRLFHRFGVHGTSIGKLLSTTSKSKSPVSYTHLTLPTILRV